MLTSFDVVLIIAPAASVARPASVEDPTSDGSAKAKTALTQSEKLLELITSSCTACCTSRTTNRRAANACAAERCSETSMLSAGSAAVLSIRLNIQRHTCGASSLLVPCPTAISANPSRTISCSSTARIDSRGSSRSSGKDARPSNSAHRLSLTLESSDRSLAPTRRYADREYLAIRLSGGARVKITSSKCCDTVGHKHTIRFSFRCAISASTST